MKKTRRTVEQIIRILREADGGVPVEEVCRQHSVSTQSYYRWRAKYGGMEKSINPRPREAGDTLTPSEAAKRIRQARNNLRMALNIYETDLDAVSIAV